MSFLRLDLLFQDYSLLDHFCLQREVQDGIFGYWEGITRRVPYSLQDAQIRVTETNLVTPTDHTPCKEH